MANHVHRVRIYYEDTDLSGAVYHANYLRFFERAREHIFGPDRLVGLLADQGWGFVVYRADLTFRAPAHLGDELEIRSSWHQDGRFRAMFDQAAWRPGEERALVEAKIQLACVDRDGTLVPLPDLPP